MRPNDFKLKSDTWVQLAYNPNENSPRKGTFALEISKRSIASIQAEKIEVLLKSFR
jgi:hypothetical protein